MIGVRQKREIERQIIHKYFTPDWYSHLAKDLEANSIGLKYMNHLKHHDYLFGHHETIGVFVLWNDSHYPAGVEEKLSENGYPGNRSEGK